MRNGAVVTVAFRLQARAFAAAVGLALAVALCAGFDEPQIAVALAILGALAVGISIGGWIIADEFKD